MTDSKIGIGVILLLFLGSGMLVIIDALSVREALLVVTIGGILWLVSQMEPPKGQSTTAAQ